MRLISALSSLTILLSAALAAACGPGGGSTESSTGTGPGGSTSAATEGGSSSATSTAATTGPGTTTTNPSTTGPETTTAATGSETSAPATSTSPGSTGSTTMTGPGNGGCLADTDCQLHNDCCSCHGEPVDEPDPSCDKQCDQPTCDALGIQKAMCRFGVCVTERVNCSGMVLCDSLPPDCPQGTLPGISGGCWSGACVPVESCDGVPDCSYCPGSTMCVQYVALLGTTVCEPIPADCPGQPTCDCAGQMACSGEFSICHEGDKGSLVCECPNC